MKLLARSLYVECVISTGACYLILPDVLDLFVDSEIEKVSFSIVKTGTSEELTRAVVCDFASLQCVVILLRYPFSDLSTTTTIVTRNCRVF